MAYLVSKNLKGREYFYLVHSIKINKKVKKFQIYIGIKKPSPRKIEKYSNKLKKRIKEYMEKIDPFFKMVRKNDLKELEKVKKMYSVLSQKSPTVRENYYEWFITTYTYDTNAIEGSTLTLRETSMVLFEGVSPSGRPLRDVIAAENHKKAFDWIISYKGDINKQFILKLHKILTKGILSTSESGKLRTVQVYVRGAKEIPPKPDEVYFQLKSLINWYKVNKKRYHPVVLASYFHTAFEGIHPFVDFNGRTGRLLLNFILMKNSYPPIDIRNKKKYLYYKAISEAVSGNIDPFVSLVINYIREIGKSLS